MTSIDNAAVANRRLHGTFPPVGWARCAGLLYLVTIICGVLAVYVVGADLIVRNDAAATASRILANEFLYRLGIIVELMGVAAYVGVTAIFYVLFRPVNRTLSLLAACFSLTGIAVGAVNLGLEFAPLAVLHGDMFGLVGAEADKLAYAFLRLRGAVNSIGLIFFGFYCALIGWLTIRSTFMPKAVGIAFLAAGICWLVANIGMLLIPATAPVLGTLLFGGIAGEAVMAVWLTIFGIDADKWQRLQAAP